MGPYDFTHMWNPVNKLNKENGDRLLGGEQDDSWWGQSLGVEGWSKKEKGLMDMDNSGVTAGGGGIKGLNGNGKNTNKD